MKTVKILVFPVSKYDRREDVEFIEGNTYLIDTLETIPNDIGDYSLSDFVTLCNDEEFNIDGHWITWVYFDDGKNNI